MTWDVYTVEIEHATTTLVVEVERLHLSDLDEGTALHVAKQLVGRVIVRRRLEVDSD